MPEVADPFTPRRKELDAQTEALKTRQAALDAESASVHQRQDSEMRPVEDALSTELNAPTPKREHVDMPLPPDVKQVFNGKDYQQFSTMLLGLALIGGAASHGNWLGVTKTLSGALQGWHDGKHEQAQRMLDDYKMQFDAAKAKEAQANREYEDVLGNRNLSINQKLQQIRILAAQHGRQDIALAAQQKNLDAVAKQIEGGKNMLTQAEARHEDMQQRLADSRQNHADMMELRRQQLADARQRHADVMAARGTGIGGVKGAPQTPEGMDLAAEVGRLQGSMPSFFGGKGLLFDTLAKKGVTADEYVTGKIEVAANTSAARQAVTKLQGVERLTSAVEQLQDEVVMLARANGNGQVPAFNATMNSIKRNMGDGELQALHTLMSSTGRLYTEAVTMPGSNAQMHATAQEWATGLFNENMSLDQIRGAIYGMNKEIQATRGALEKQVTEAVHRGHKPGGTASAPAARTAPYSDPEKERRYQEWKAQHGGGQ